MQRAVWIDSEDTNERHAQTKNKVSGSWCQLLLRGYLLNQTNIHCQLFKTPKQKYIELTYCVHMRASNHTATK